MADFKDTQTWRMEADNGWGYPIRESLLDYGIWFAKHLI